jgi:hypothetical protein
MSCCAAAGASSSAFIFVQEPPHIGDGDGELHWQTIGREKRPALRDKRINIHTQGQAAASMEPIAWQRGLCFGLRRDPVTEAQSLADVLSCGSSAGRQGDE